MDPYIDIHCHPDIFPYNRMRNTKEEYKNEFSLWYSDPPKNWEKGSRGRVYTQSDFPSMIEGNVNIAFVGLTPLEKEFFLGRRKENGEPSFINSIKQIRNTLTYGKSPIRRIATSIVTTFPLKRIKYLQSDVYDYFDELNSLYAFYEKNSSRIVEYRFRDKVVRARYITASNIQEVEHAVGLSKKDSIPTIIIIFTIEGGHVLSVKSDGSFATEKELKKRIDTLKHKKFHPLFISLAHHFYNGLCGHAFSFPQHLQWISDQSPGINTGLTSLGKSAIEALLSLNDSSTRRIFIDVKHMSAQARKEFYELFIIPYNRKHPRNPVPVIASHVAYADVETIEELIHIASFEMRNSPMSKRGFVKKSLNLCDDEIRIIHRSGGLIGLILDETRLATKQKRKEMKEHSKEHYSIQIIIDQIIAIVEAIQSDSLLEKSDRKNIWDSLCIGSDFDGFVDPPDTFYSSATFPDLENSLIRGLKKHPFISDLLHDLDVEEAVSKIMHDNAINFLQKHFHVRK